MNRGALRVFNHGAATLETLGVFSRNLFGVAALICLAFAIADFLRTPGYASIARRLFTAMFAGVFLLTAALSILLPAELFSPAPHTIVRLGNGAAHVMVALLGTTVLWRRRAPVRMRTMVALMALSSFGALGAQAWQAVGNLAIRLAFEGSFLALLQAGSRYFGEIAYLLVPFFAGAVLLPRGRTLRELASSGVFMGVGTAVGLVLLRASALDTFGILLYGAQRLTLLLGEANAVYAAILGFGWGATAAGLVRSDPRARQVALGLGLFLAAGYSPGSTGTAIAMTLAVALASRAAVGPIFDSAEDEFFDERRAVDAE